MSNKQPFYHDVQFTPAPTINRKELLAKIQSLVPKAQQDMIELSRDQLLFTAYSDRSAEVKARMERLGIVVISSDAEPGDPADLM